MAPPGDTRQRLLDAGMHLFATRGFTGTTVGEIEATAGLQPRRGALYKHFESKDALLDAAVARHLDSVATGAAQVASVSFVGVGDEGGEDIGLARSLVLEIGRWFLAELDRQEAMTRILEREGDRVDELRALARERIIEVGYRASARHVRAVAPDADAEAIAAVLMGSLVAFRRTTWTFGASPLRIDDERILEAWADTCIATLRDLQAGGATARENW